MPNLGRWSSQRARYRVALLLTELPAAASAFELRASNHSFGVLSTTFEPQLNKQPQTTTENVYVRHILHILKRGRRKEVTFRKALSLRIETVPKTSMILLASMANKLPGNYYGWRVAGSDDDINSCSATSGTTRWEE